MRNTRSEWRREQKLDFRVAYIRLRFQKKHIPIPSTIVVCYVWLEPTMDMMNGIECYEVPSKTLAFGASIYEDKARLLCARLVVGRWTLSMQGVDEKVREFDPATRAALMTLLSTRPQLQQQLTPSTVVSSVLRVVLLRSKEKTMMEDDDDVVIHG